MALKPAFIEVTPKSRTRIFYDRRLPRYRFLPAFTHQDHPRQALWVNIYDLIAVHFDEGIERIYYFDDHYDLQIFLENHPGFIRLNAGPPGKARNRHLNRAAAIGIAGDMA
jgi:hypothetical protein